MKKKSRIWNKEHSVNEPAPDYCTGSKTESTTEKVYDSNHKLFEKTLSPEDFPKNCVTLDTFFSDLEDFIHKDEEIQNRH